MGGAGTVIVHPCGSVNGRLRVPGDKSISHRIAMLSAIARGESVIRGFLRGEDCLGTLRAMESLGAGVMLEGDTARVSGIGGEWRAPTAPLDLGNSGTSMRLLAGLLASRPFTTELTGDDSLLSRPMARIRDPLALMGARLELLGRLKPDAGPIRIFGGRLKAIEYRMPVASAQVKSCVLLAGLFADGVTRVIEPAPTRDHTERILNMLGVKVAVDGPCVELRGFGERGPALNARSWDVPGDISSAAFWLAAGAMLPGSSVAVEGVGLNPRRSGILDVLRRMGACLSIESDPAAPGGEPFGNVIVAGAELKGTDVAGSEIPNLIDELPVLACAAAMAEGVTTIRDAAELRRKESDRIACMARNLAALGVRVEEKPDGLVIRGKAAVKGGVEVDSFNDHRIAMSFAVLALAADAPVRISGVACVDTSYPGFWDHLRSLGAHVENDNRN